MESPEAIREALAHHNCTDHYWQALPEYSRFLYTDGVKVMAEMCEAYWLINAVFSWQCESKVKNEPFQVWILRFNDKEKGDDALLICEDGNNRELARQEILCTDFPLPEGIKMYFCNEILMLPSEY